MTEKNNGKNGSESQDKSLGNLSTNNNRFKHSISKYLLVFISFFLFQVIIGKTYGAGEGFIAKDADPLNWIEITEVIPRFLIISGLATFIYYIISRMTKKYGRIKRDN